ncbi:MAG: hypothetical protein ABI383_07685 [Acidobacteriaceae bacterium]
MLPEIKAKQIRLTLAIFLAFSMAALAKDTKMVNKGPAPAATGNIHTDNDDNGNTTLELKVSNLAAAQKLTPPAQCYVVWVQERGRAPMELGTLKTNDDLSGKIDGTTPAKLFDVFITAEGQPNPESPRGPVVLSGHVDRTQS